MSIFRKISLLIFLLSILLFFVPFFESNKLYSDTDFQIQLEGFSLFCLGIIIFILSPKRKILTSKQQQSKNYWKRKRIDTIFTVIGVLFAIPVALLILIMILFPTNTSWTGVVFPFYLFILEFDSNNHLASSTVQNT